MDGVVFDPLYVAVIERLNRRLARLEGEVVALRADLDDARTLANLLAGARTKHRERLDVLEGVAVLPTRRGESHRLTAYEGEAVS